jgi:hypothetical protein
MLSVVLNVKQYDIKGLSLDRSSESCDGIEE